jgi:hypothetical protein
MGFGKQMPLESPLGLFGLLSLCGKQRRHYSLMRMIRQRQS